MRRLFAFLLLSWIPSLTWAAGFNPSGSDKSLEYLGMVFGQVGNLPISALGNQLFSEMMRIINEVAFGLAVVVVIYTTVVSTIQTAQEGETMGKKWSTIWVPFRAASGIYLLLPTATGYSYIQIMVMWFVTQSVGAANALWERVLDSYDQGLGFHETEFDGAAADLKNGSGTIFNILKSEICSAYLNDNEAAQQVLNKEPITSFLQGKNIIWGTPSNGNIYCGEMSVQGTANTLAKAQNSMGSSGKDHDRIQNQLQTLIQQLARSNLAVPAQEAVAWQNDQIQWAMANELRFAANALQDKVQKIIESNQSTVSGDDLSQTARLEGWIHAANYYFKLVNGSAQAATPTTVSFNHQEMDLTSLFGSHQGGIIENQINRLTNDYAKYAAERVGRAPKKSEMGIGVNNAGMAKLDDEAAEIMNIFFGSLFKELAIKLSKAITTHDGDPLVSISRFGGILIGIVEDTFFIALMSTFGLFIISSIMSCLVPMGHVLDAILSIIMPVALFIIAVLWVAGITLGLYLPLIPLLVFTFASVAWILLVIEAIVAAPLVSLSLVVPSEDEIGKAGHSMVILVGLFLRPSLMIVGFIIAAKLLAVAIQMLNFGFKGLLLSSLPNVGLFGGVAIVVIYVGFATAIVHESFTLIYLLPDKILRWMGGQAENTDDAMSKARKTEKSAEKGASVTKGMAGGALKFAQSKAK
jgi:conjugal transfer/type IV secretion protein DotA/TraY